MAILSVEAILTNSARARIAKMLETGKSYKITHFLLGDEGHDPEDPTIALTPNPAAQTCMGNVFGPKAVAGVTYANASCPVWQCTITAGEYVGPVSALCLVATIVYSPDVGDPEVGLTFTAAVATRPLFIQSDLDTLDVFVAIQS